MAKQRVFWLWILAAALPVLLIAFLAVRYPEALYGHEAKGQLIQGVVLLALLLGSAALHRRSPPGHILRNVGLWTAIAVALFAGYSYRFELLAIKDRMVAELLPRVGVEVALGAVSFRADASGHFVVEATVDGVNIRFLVDTGASDVVLSPADAERLGFDLKKLSYTRRFETANGIVVGAPVRLGSVAVGPIGIADVRATVNGAPMQNSLLGMSFLGRLSGYQVSRDTLVLRR
ncbi:MAG: TIGR02281 family clan AA aspartic protease [Rhodospirillales bacterium]|nr:TIGR02281 family clan AA aspartic protease [Rhodospirillales bacterium]